VTASDTSPPGDRSPRQVAGPAVEGSGVDPDARIQSPEPPGREADAVVEAEDPPAAGSDPGPQVEPVAEPAPVPEPEPVAEPVPEPEPAEPASVPEPDPVAEPVPEPEPVAEPAPVPEPDPVAEPALESASAAEPGPPRGRPGRFMGESGELRERWDAVQTGFVDDPNRAVAQADELVSMAVAALHAHVEQRREDLAETWRGGRQVSTDTLRTAFQSYRELFEGVLST
jgi:outer membrane biosynthesis protein TonB